MHSTEMMTAAHTMLPENTSPNTLPHFCKSYPCEVRNNKGMYTQHILDNMYTYIHI